MSFVFWSFFFCRENWGCHVWGFKKEPLHYSMPAFLETHFLPRYLWKTIFFLQFFCRGPLGNPIFFFCYFLGFWAWFGTAFESLRQSQKYSICGLWSIGRGEHSSFCRWRPTMEGWFSKLKRCSHLGPVTLEVSKFWVWVKLKRTLLLFVDSLLVSLHFLYRWCLAKFKEGMQ